MTAEIFAHSKLSFETAMALALVIRVPARQAIGSWPFLEFSSHLKRTWSPTTRDQVLLRRYSNSSEKSFAPGKGLGENRRMPEAPDDGLHKSSSDALVLGVRIDAELGDIGNECLIAEDSDHAKQAIIGFGCGEGGKQIRAAQEPLSEILNRQVVLCNAKSDSLIELSDGA